MIGIVKFVIWLFFTVLALLVVSLIHVDGSIGIQILVGAAVACPFMLAAYGIIQRGDT